MSGLSDFSDAAVHDPAVVALAGKVRYEIDPKNPYPKNFTGHIRAVLADGRVIEERQPHMRGGAHEPLTRADIEEKFMLNARHGGWDEARAAKALALLRTLYDGKIDLSSLREAKCPSMAAREERMTRKAASPSSPAPGAISAAASRWRSPTAAPRSWSTRARTCRRRKRVAGEIERAGGKALAVTADVADADAVNRMVDAAAKQFGRIDILVNNAAVRVEQAFEGMTLAQWRAVTSIILDGAFNCVQACLPHLKKSGAARSSISAGSPPIPARRAARMW